MQLLERREDPYTGFSTAHPPLSGCVAVKERVSTNNSNKPQTPKKGGKSKRLCRTTIDTWAGRPTGSEQEPRQVRELVGQLCLQLVRLDEEVHEVEEEVRPQRPQRPRRP